MNTLLKPVYAMAGAVACVAGCCFAAEGWGTDFNQGLATAAAEGRPVLVEFTGSDWCPPCMYVRSKFLPTQEFKDFAEKNKLVLVELDFPRGAGKVTPEVRAEREAISSRYKIDGFPTMLVMDGEGRVYARVVGAERTAEAYIAKLQVGLDAMSAFKAKVTEAQKLSGVEKAKALSAALEVLPADCREQQTDVVEEILSNDPEDATGFRKAAEQKKLKEAQVMEFQQALYRSTEKIMVNKNTSSPSAEDLAEIVSSTREEANKMLEREELLPEVRQIIYGFVSESYIVEKDYAHALEYLEKSIEAAPNSQEVDALKMLRAKVENQLKK